jgi:hypothetical protein
MNPQIDISKIIKRTNQDAFLNQLTEYGFKQHPRGYRCKESSGLNLFYDRHHEKWICKNHSNKLPVPDGDIWTFTKRLYNEAGNTFESIQRIATHICDAQGLHLNEFISESNTIYHTPKKRAKKGIKASQAKPSQWKPNDKGQLNTSYEYALSSWNSLIGESVIRYFRRYGIDTETLKKYSVQPLESIRHIETGRIKTFTLDDPAFIYKVGENIKYKHPGARNKKYSNGYIQSAGNYVFGLDQLPDHCKRIIIAAGEKDTIALNQHFNRHGTYAICFGSESADIPANIINCLRNKCNEIICLFDNDKTGEQFARVNAQRHGIGFIRIADTVNDPARFDGNYSNGINTTLNDVCDILQHHGINLLESIVNGYVHKNSTHDDIRIVFDQYLSERSQDIKKAIQAHDKLIIQAPTGGGKTFALLNIAQDSEYLKTINCEWSIFCTPTNMIAEQIQSEARTKGIDIPIINGTWTNEKAQQYAQSKIYIAVYDSLKKINDIIFNSLLIVDESHLIFDANSYRQKAVSQVWEYLNASRKAVLISGTPYNIPEYTLFNACQHNGQSFKVTPVYYQGTKSNFNIPAPGDGVTIIRINDKSILHALKQTIGSTAEVITSDDKESNLVYQSIINTGTIPDHIQYLLVTSVTDTGVSIRSKIDAIHLFDCNVDNEALQAMARARRNAGLNNNIPVFVYHKFKSDQYECIEAQHQDGRHSLLFNILQEYNLFAIDTTRDHNVQLKRLQTIKNDIHTKQSINNFTYFSEVQNEYIVNLPTVYFEAYKQYRGDISNEQFYKDIVSKNPNITINDPVLIEFTGTTSEAVKLNKEERKAMKEQAFEAFLNEPDIITEAVCHTTKNGTLKQKIRQKLYPGHLPSTMVAQAMNQFKELLSGGYFDTPVNRYIQLLDIGIDPGEASRHVYNNQGRKQWNVIHNAIMIIYRAQESEAPRATIIKQQAQNLYETVRQSGKKEFTINQLKKLLIKAGHTKFDTNDKDIVYLRFAELYELERSRKTINGRKQTVYIIGNKWTKTALKNTANLFNKNADVKPSQSIDIHTSVSNIVDIRKDNYTINIVDRLSVKQGHYIGDPVPF